MTMRTDERPLLSSNPALHVMKSVGSSGMFLAAAICLSAYLAFYTVYLFQFGETISRLYQNLFLLAPSTSPVPPPEVQASLITMMRGMLTGIMAVAAVPSLLSLIGLWLHYGACRSRKSGGISTSGLTLWKVLHCIRLAGLSLYGALLLLMCFLGLFAGGIMGISGAVSGEKDAQTAGIMFAVVYFVMFLVMAALLTPGILYSVFQLKLLDRTRQVAFTGIPDGRVSRFVIVMNYIQAVCMGISALVLAAFSFAAVPVSGMGEVSVDFGVFLLGGASGLAHAAFLILAALCLSRYRREMGKTAAYFMQWQNNRC